MALTSTSLFRSNKTQAVRLPKAVAFGPDVSAVTIRKVGQRRVIAPQGASWDEWFDRDGGIGEVFPATRDQGNIQERN